MSKCESSKKDEEKLEKITKENEIYRNANEASSYINSLNKNNDKISQAAVVAGIYLISGFDVNYSNQ